MKKRDTERRTVQANFRLTPSQKATIDRLAAEKDWSFSKFVRKLVEKAMEEK